MKSTSLNDNREFRIPAAVILTWLLPGAGHLFIGERGRGIILMVAIAVTFWAGVAIGGVKSTVDPEQRTLWFLAQGCAGGHALTAVLWSKMLQSAPGEPPAALIAYSRTEDVAVVYTAICGMLNLLIMLDVAGRASIRPVVAPPRRGPTPKSKGTSP